MYVQYRGEHINWNIAGDVAFLLKVVRQRTRAECKVQPSNDAILYCALLYMQLN